MRDLLGAVEGGGSKFLCALGTGPGDVRAEARFETRDPESTLRDVIRFFEPHRKELATIGVCTFGPLELDPRSGDRFGSVLTSPKPGWRNAPLRAFLSESLEVPVHVDTDVNGAALAEQRWGAAVGADPVAYVTVGTGVGVGVVVMESPLHGLLHGELGHVLVPRASGDDFAGVCPFHGACVEGLASAPALRVRTGREPHELRDDDPVWELEARYLAALLHTVVLAYAPRRIVLGGGVLEREVLLQRVRRSLVESLSGYVPRRELTFEGISEYVVPPRFRERAGLMGAFVLAGCR